MNVKKSLPIFVMGLLMPGLATASHHEKSEGVALAAQPGQVMIVYHWPCADADRGLALLKEMIAYESKAAPYPYSAAPAIHEDGALVSVDVHSSADSMEKATAWQADDEAWQAQFAEMEAACGSADDLSMTVLSMQ